MRVDVNQDVPSQLFFLVVLMSPIVWGLHDTLVPLDSTYGSSGLIIKKIKMFIRLLSYILHVVERLTLVWSLFQNVCGALKHIYIQCLWVLLTHVYWFRATGGYICGCERPRNLVKMLDCFIMATSIKYSYLNIL